MLQNLRNAFPEKTNEEINVICRNFYHYLCDLFLEVIKGFTISKTSMLKRCNFTPQSYALLNKLADEQKSIILVMGHIGNWEWAGLSFSLLCKQQLYVIYHPIANKYFDKLMLGLRTRFGTRTIAMRNTYKEMLAHKNITNATVFLADQTPQPNSAYWTSFLNQDTPVFKGTEVIAKKLNLAVVYASVKKIRRGYYEMNVEILSASPANTAEGEISEMHTKRIEKDIIATPENWLWSHRRWKHKREHTK